MPKKINDELKARAVRLVSDHQQEYPSLSAAAEAVAKQVGVGKESGRRWVIQAQVDSGTRAGVRTEESDDIKRLKGENWQLREDVAILRAATTFFAGLDRGRPARSRAVVPLPGSASTQRWS